MSHRIHTCPHSPLSPTGTAHWGRRECSTGPVARAGARTAPVAAENAAWSGYASHDAGARHRSRTTWDQCLNGSGSGPVPGCSALVPPIQAC